MFADRGEKVDAMAAAKMISRFWPAVRTEYGSVLVLTLSNGAVSSKSDLLCAVISLLLDSIQGETAQPDAR